MIGWALTHLVRLVRSSRSAGLPGLAGATDTRSSLEYLFETGTVDSVPSSAPPDPAVQAEGPITRPGYGIPVIASLRWANVLVVPLRLLRRRRARLPAHPAVRQVGRVPRTPLKRTPTVNGNQAGETAISKDPFDRPRSIEVVKAGQRELRRVTDVVQPAGSRQARPLITQNHS
jgi:hypothetical protein